jgi:hypothetical protein
MLRRAFTGRVANTRTSRPMRFPIRSAVSNMANHGRSDRFSAA